MTTNDWSGIDGDNLSLIYYSFNDAPVGEGPCVIESVRRVGAGGRNFSTRSATSSTNVWAMLGHGTAELGGFKAFYATSGAWAIGSSSRISRSERLLPSTTRGMPIPRGRTDPIPGRALPGGPQLLRRFCR